MPESKFIHFDSRTPNPNFNGVEDITATELQAKKTQVAIIDVRRPDEWVGEYGHIPEAKLMTLDTLPDRIDELPKDQTIVFICRSGGRSAQAAAFAQSNGLKNVFNMKGGMITWTELKFEAADKNAD